MGKIAATLLGIWVSIVSVIGVWPIVGEAPWEKRPWVGPLCEDALIRRRAVEEALRREYTGRDGSYPLRSVAGSSWDVTPILVREIGRLNDELGKRNIDVFRFCPSEQS